LQGPSAERRVVNGVAQTKLALNHEGISQLIGTSLETINSTHSEFNYVLFLGNALVLVVFLDPSLCLVLFLHDAHEPVYLPGNAIASATAEKEICRWGDH
jgi:hypothetical protein